MGESRLLFLRRFWLESAEAQFADPEPVAGAARAPRVAPALAYAIQQGANALPLAAITALLAAAYALVYGLVGRINLAFGELAAAGGYAALFGLVLGAGSGPLAALALGGLLAVSAALWHGVAAGAAVFAPLHRATGQQALVATVGLSLFLQEYLRLTQGTGLRWAGPILADPIALVRAGGFVATVTPGALLLAGVAAAAACVLLAGLALSRFGREWRAYADDPLAATLCGVDGRAVFARTFAVGSALAGLAGGIMTAYYGGVGYAASTALGLKALVGAILGGIGSVPGALLGGVAIGLFEAAWSATFPIVYRDVAVYAVLAAVLVWRPGGLFGYAEATPRGV